MQQPELLGTLRYNRRRPRGWECDTVGFKPLWIWWQGHALVQLIATATQPLTLVLDATIGPYVASTYADYLTMAIDTSTDALQLYAYWSGTPVPPPPNNNQPQPPSGWQDTYNGLLNMGIFADSGVQPNVGLAKYVTPNSGVSSVTVIASSSSST